MDRLDEIQIELMATQYWLKYLYLANATGITIKSGDIRDVLNHLKNLSPFDHEPLLLPAEWDERSLERYPIYERVGLSIANMLEQINK